MKHTKLFLIALALFSILNYCMAAPLSEQQAFCTDRVWGLYSSAYETQKAFNQCLKNADRLIDQYEQKKKYLKAESASTPTKSIEELKIESDAC